MGLTEHLDSSKETADMDLSMPAGTPAPPPRRLVAAGLIRRSGGRTTRVTITRAGATGSIRPAGAR
jgi:hypothetical protein